MSTITKPPVLDESFLSEIGALNSKLDAQNHLLSHQNAAIDLLASDKRASLVEDVATVAELCASGEILEVMDYGDQIAPAWSDGETEYAPAMNLCHEADAELEDGETIHGAFFEWDKTTPTGIQFDAPEALYYFDGTETPGDYYITIGKTYGDGWIAGQSIQITLSEAPAENDQLVVNCGGDSKNNPTNGRTWSVYAKGGTEAKQTGTTSNGTSGTKLGETDGTDAGKTNGRVNAPQGVVYGYNRWAQSALRQYLNSSAAAGAWWTAQNPWDRPPAQHSTIRGFLAGYDAEVIRNFKPIKIVTVTCNADGNVEDVTYDRIFLSSLEQMYCVPQFAGKEGEYWEYYKRLLGRTSPAPTSTTYKRLIKYALNAPTSAQLVFRRSANRPNAISVWYVSSNGFLSTGSALNVFRCAPGVFLSL